MCYLSSMKTNKLLFAAIQKQPLRKARPLPRKVMVKKKQEEDVLLKLFDKAARFVTTIFLKMCGAGELCQHLDGFKTMPAGNGRVMSDSRPFTSDNVFLHEDEDSGLVSTEEPFDPMQPARDAFPQYAYAADPVAKHFETRWEEDMEIANEAFKKWSEST